MVLTNIFFNLTFGRFCRFSWLFAGFMYFGKHFGLRFRFHFEHKTLKIIGFLVFLRSKHWTSLGFLEISRWNHRKICGFLEFPNSKQRKSLGFPRSPHSKPSKLTGFLAFSVVRTCHRSSQDPSNDYKICSWARTQLLYKRLPAKNICLSGLGLHSGQWVGCRSDRVRETAGRGVMK